MRKEYLCVVSFRSTDAEGKTQVKRICSLRTISKTYAELTAKSARKDPMILGAFVEEVIIE